MDLGWRVCDGLFVYCGGGGGLCVLLGKGTKGWFGWVLEAGQPLDQIKRTQLAVNFVVATSRSLSDCRSSRLECAVDG